MFTRYKICLHLWTLIRKVTLLLQKILRFPFKNVWIVHFFSNAAPKCQLFSWELMIFIMNQCICLSQPGAANSEPRILSKSHDILSANIPPTNIDQPHPPPKKKRCIFAFRKPIFTAGVFGDPISFLVKFSEPSTGQPAPGRFRKGHPFIMVLLNNPDTTR